MNFWQNPDGSEYVEYGHSSLPVVPHPVAKNKGEERNFKSKIIKFLICDLSHTNDVSMMNIGFQ